MTWCPCCDREVETVAAGGGRWRCAECGALRKDAA